MRRRILGMVLSLVLVLMMLPPSVMQVQAQVDTVYVSDQGDDSNAGLSADTPVKSINRALELAASGDIISVTGSVYIEPIGGTDDPLIIDKAVTITGTDSTDRPYINVRTGGVILGADVTFKNLNYCPESFVRPGIAANGHALSLVNVHLDGGARPLQVYGGTMFDITETTDLGADYTGGASVINIIGGSYEAVYAGSINGDFDKSVTINVSRTEGENSYSLALDSIYSGGAQKISTSEAGSIPVPYSDYAVGSVSVTVTNASVGTISGVKAENTVLLTVSSENLYECAIDNIDNLTVVEGVFAPTGTWNNGTNVTLCGSEDNKATLDLSGFAQILQMQNFTDNGAPNILVLPDYEGSDASLIINGTHAGTTELRVAGGMPWSSEDNQGYSGWMEYEHTYVTTAGGDGSFVIANPYSTQGWYDENGVYNGITMEKSVADATISWMTSAEVEEEMLVEVVSFSIEDEEISVTYEDINAFAKEVLLNVEFTEDSYYEDISFVPITYKVTYGQDIYEFTTNEEVYIYDIEELNLCLDAYSTVLYVGKMEGDAVGNIAAGEYRIEMTVPTTTGTATDSFVLNVISEDGTVTPEPTDAPTPEPTDTPSPEPTDTPTAEPTDTPSPEPADTPTPEPSETPSPSAEPTDTPSAEPTDTPSPEPSETPSPSAEPTDTPSAEPTDTPSPEPTDTPTPEPSETPSPSPEPTDTPSPEPTDTPTAEPTDTPSPEPTDTPSPEPTDTPSPEPTDTPSPEPTDTPSPEPTDTPSPSPEPTDTPSPEPTDTPSPEPTDTPSPEPTDTPSPEPTDTPTAEPADTPTAEPSETPSPSAEPTDTPSPEPSETPIPSAEPTDMPTPEPTDTPSPSAEPTDTPTAEPSETPSPSAEPTDTPTPEPSETPSPSAEPTDTPSPEPSETPSPTPTITPNISYEEGINSVPSGLVNTEYDSVEEIVEALQEAITQHEGFGVDNTTIWNVTLMVRSEDGGQWIPATEENFPEEGLDIVLPYPSGTSKDTHDFMISHMFTTNVNGHTPGELENPTVIKMDDGLHLRVDGLSPFMIAFKAVEQSNVEGNESSGQPETTSAPEPTPSESREGAVKAPKMDDGLVGVWIVIISLLGIGLFMITWGTRRYDDFE